uniref:Flagellar basal-body rod protein FlgC n=1 Tax=mine drainage metagenome TaxID=410659 RepID=E6QMC2_9ZZZZ
MNLFGMMDNSGTALQAERMRAEVVAANMANAETTRTAAGTPYHRQHVIFAAGSPTSFAGQVASNLTPQGQMTTLTSAAAMPLAPLPLPGSASVAPGVHIAGVIEDPAPPLKRYDPGHPDADGQGYVSYPDINPLTEMVDLMGATRAYGLNSSAVQAEKSMITSSLELAK